MFNKVLQIKFIMLINNFYILFKKKNDGIGIILHRITTKCQSKLTQFLDKTRSKFFSEIIQN